MLSEPPRWRIRQRKWSDASLIGEVLLERATRVFAKHKAPGELAVSMLRDAMRADRRVRHAVLELSLGDTQPRGEEAFGELAEFAPIAASLTVSCAQPRTSWIISRYTALESHIASFSNMATVLRDTQWFQLVGLAQGQRFVSVYSATAMRLLALGSHARVRTQAAHARSRLWAVGALVHD